jgi:tetraacyldisaccharide 4'-kinase
MTPPELLYYLGYAVHRGYGTKKQKRLPARVISIGNITLGGTGKTPATIAMTHEAKQRGFMPCILTRGYGGKAKGPCFVSKGEGPLMNAYDAGDEAFLMAEKLKGVPVVKGQNRYEAGMFALGNYRFQAAKSQSEWIFILDDGFQHWGLFRDMDILLVDGMNPFGNRKLLPLGYLREPVIEISRADIIVITNANRIIPHNPSPITHNPDLMKEIKQYNPTAPVFFSEHRPAGFTTVAGDSYPLEWAKGREVYGFCGIGNPQSFGKTLASTGADIKCLKTFRDHYRFSPDDMKTIAADAGKAGAAWIVTTEKDIMRLRGFDLPENLVALEIEFSAEKRLYDRVFQGFHM